MRYALAAGVVLSAALGAGCTVRLDSQSQIVREEKRFTVTGAADLRVTTFDGSIQVQSWDRSDIVIEVEKRGTTKESVDALEIRSEQTGDLVDLEVKRPRSETFTGIGFQRSATARLIVSVPRNTNIRARSGDGSISVEGVTGRLELRTGDGSIKVEDVAGDLTLNTGDGSVTVDGAEGKLDLSTGDGGVSVTGKLSAVRLHTGDGAIVYRAQPGTAMTGDWEITTGDGSVTLYLPREFGAEIDAYTGDGAIRNDLEVASDTLPDLERANGEGPNLERRDQERREDRKETSKRTLRGRIGNGGHPVRIRTGDGAIRLRVS